MRRRRARVLAIATMLSLGLSACSGDETPAVGAAPGRAGSSVVGYPGLYYDASLVSVASTVDDQLRLVGTMTCAEMDAMLTAGQWRVVDRLALPAGSAGAAIAGIVPGLLLERGGTLAFVTLKGERDLCTGTVTKAQREGIAVKGNGFPGPTTGWSATSMCVRLGADTLNVSLYFDTTPKLGGLVTVTLVTRDGKSTVDETSGDLNVMLLAHQSSVLETYSRVFAGEQDLPGVTAHSLEPGDAFSGTATVDAGTADRPRGSFTVTGLIDVATDEEVSLSLPFACASVQVLKA